MSWLLLTLVISMHGLNMKFGLTMFNFVGCNVVTQKASKNKHNYLHHNFKI